MTERQPIGVILLLREALESNQLMQTLRDQTRSPKDRLVTMLIKRALIEIDEGALALSEQTGYPAALQRHLERRHVDVESSIPFELAQRWMVMPIGRSNEGELIMCARDPTPILAASLQHALRTPISLAVTPSFLIERLLSSVYGSSAVVPPSEGAVTIAETVTIADPGSMPVTSHEMQPARTVSRALGLRPSEKVAPLEATLQEIDHAVSIAAVERLLIAYAAQRWRAALLVKINGGIAFGHRGCGDRLGSVEAFMLPLASPSLIQIAYDTMRIARKAPHTELQDRLSALLGDPSMPLAGPAFVGGAVEAVLVVGDPLEGTGQESAADLERLLDALGASYERFSRRM